MKPFCSAKQGIAAIEAFNTIFTKIGSKEIDKVRVRVPPAYAGMISTRAVPGARQSTMVSVAHQIGLTATEMERLYEVDRSSTEMDAAVTRFAAKVEVIADAKLDTYYPQHWPAEVEVEAGGEVHRKLVVEANGDPERPLDRAGVVAKAVMVLAPLVGGDRAAEWVNISAAALDDPAACRTLADSFAAGL
jgi:2-methylcitrate dehydratase PrpD